MVIIQAVSAAMAEQKSNAGNNQQNSNDQLGKLPGARRLLKERQDIWGDIFEYDAIQYAAENKTKAATIAKKGEEIRNALKKQIDYRAKQREERRREESKYADNIQRSVKEWREENAQKQRLQNQNNLRAKQEREQSRLAKQRRDDEAKQLKVREEREAARRAKEGIENMRRRQLEKKMRQKEMQARIKRENEVVLAAKEKKREEEIAYEKRLEREYIELLDKQEAARANRLAAAEQRQERLLDLGMFAAQSAADKAQQDADRAKKQQREKEQQDATRAAEKARRRKKADNDMRDMLGRQVARKRQAQIEEQDTITKHAKEMAERAKRDLIAEQRKAAARKQANRQYRHHLESQIMSDRQRKLTTQAGMSIVEQKFNSQIIGKVNTFKTRQGLGSRDNLAHARYTKPRGEISQVPL